jgi:4,5-dihydroxyphthalate decarboxylase
LVSKLPLTFACDNYAFTRALTDGSVAVDGVDLNYLTVFPAENFQRMIQHREFDAAEMGLKFYICSLELDDPPFIAIPVFPCRIFRHSAIFVSEASPVKKPKDLIGRRVGELFAYGHDAAIWARGVMSDEYGVPIDSVTYHVGRLERDMGRDFAPFGPPPHIRVEKLEGHQTLDAMLASGEIDALYSALDPPSFTRRTGKVRRLFENYEEVERAYYRKTGIFPIMHTVVIRRDLYRANPWVAQSLYQALKEAKSSAMTAMHAHAAHMHRLDMIPFLTAHHEENRALFGDDFWPYGLEANRKTLDAFLRYHHEQGLSQRLHKPEELFAPETLTEYFPYPAALREHR